MTYHQGSPNLDRKCKIQWLRSLLFVVRVYEGIKKSKFHNAQFWENRLATRARWGAVTAFLWGQRLYCEGNAQNKHHVRWTTAPCEEQLSFQVGTCEVILYKTLPIECPGVSSMQCDVTFMLTSVSRICREKLHVHNSHNHLDCFTVPTVLYLIVLTIYAYTDPDSRGYFDF